MKNISTSIVGATLAVALVGGAVALWPVALEGGAVALWPVALEGR